MPKRLMPAIAAVALAACGGDGSNSGSNLPPPQFGSSTGGTSTSSTSSGGAAVAFRVRRVASTFSQPLYLTAIPDGSGRVLVVQKGGLVRILNPMTGAILATPFLDIAPTIATDSERGLLGLALAPDFATSGVFYVYATNTNGDNEVRRYRTLASDRNRADPTSEDVILRIPHPGFSNHNGGWIDFGPDGFLYIASGDGGGAGDPNNNAQNVNSLLGKILRIDVRSDAFPNDPVRDYAIPATNPATPGGGGLENYAYGLRNPYRASFDRETGNLFIGDVGQGAIEEINLIPANTAALNFGWNRREGTQAFNGGANSPSFTPPIAEYTHGTGPTQGRSITGGYVYRGPNATLRGQYIFGDYVSGNIWSIPVASIVQGQTFASSLFVQRNADFRPDQGTITNISSFGVDQTGNLYIVDFDGEIFVVENAA